MAEKKFGWGTLLLASGAAALVAGGVVAYLKREEKREKPRTRTAGSHLTGTSLTVCLQLPAQNRAAAIAFW